jgi:hypothetical protein
VRWVEAATEGVVATFFGESLCNGTFGGLGSTVPLGVEAKEQAIWERSA